MTRRSMLILLVGCGLAWVATVAATYLTTPRQNTDQEHFDVIIMLGSPADPDGKASWEQRERIGEAVREIKSGRAERLIVTGGAAHNQWVEADVEARLAERLGIPAADVLIEGQSQNTVQNMCYAWQIMQAHGWTSAEVISNASHLPRASLILKLYESQGLKWRVHASPLPREYHVSFIVGRYLLEALDTWRLRWFGFPRTRYVP
jgi:uncharacterized SAM-binding protein YcdF (DUF218 family)